MQYITIAIKSSYYHPRKSTKKVRVVGAEPKVHEELLQQRWLIGEQPGCTVPEDFHHGGGDVDGDVDGDHYDHYNHKAKNRIMVASDHNHQDVKEEQDQYYKFNQMVHYDAGI